MKKKEEKTTWTPIKRYLNKSKIQEKKINESYNSIKPNNNVTKDNNIKEFVGVCPNCLNGELQACHHCKKQDSNTTDYDPFTKQMLRNQKVQNQIKQQISNRYNQTQEVAKLLPNQTKKDLLIQSQENKEFNLNVQTNDLAKQKTLSRYKRNQELIKNMHTSENPKVEEYYKNNTLVTDGSVCSIGTKPLNKKNIPTISQYKKELDSQINEKEIKNVKERENAQRLERELYEKSKDKHEREREMRRRHINQLKNDFLMNNKMLIERKNANNLLNKSQDLEQERQNISLVNEEIINKQREEENKKLKTRNELKKALDEQIRLKMNDNNNKNENNAQKPVYLEDYIIDEYGRCIKCHKKYKKELLSNIKELTKIKAYRDNL